MASLHERYLEGHSDFVWHALRQVGDRAREPRLRDDVDAVVREAMTRARRNVETLLERLRGDGYRFGDPFDQEGEGAAEPHAPPDAHTPAFSAWLEDRFGPLPGTARAWIDVVGDVSLLGTHPAWPPGLVLDPLVVEVEHKAWRFVRADRSASRAACESEHDAWRDARDGLGADGAACADGAASADGEVPFVLPVAPDALHKANVSGGAPYGFLLPDGSADASFRFVDGVVLPFVEYLGLAFRCGGFPGAWRRDHGPAVWRSIRDLARDLLPL